jgi:hypothetical protein
MSEEPVSVDLNRGTVSFQRRLQKGDVSLMISMQFDVDPTDLKGSVQRARDVAFQVKGVVYEELGIEFEVDESGTLREKNAPEPPREERQGQQGQLPIPNQRPEHVKDWQWAKLVNNPGDFFDNRDPATGFNPTGGPDFKSKDGKTKIYLRPYQGGN